MEQEAWLWWGIGGVLLGWLTALPVALLVNQRLRTQKAVLEEQLRNEERMANAFKALSKDVLAENSQLFLQQAEQAFKRLQVSAVYELEEKRSAIETLVTPIGESLTKVQAAVDAVEKARIEAYGALRQQLDDLLRTHLPSLHKETQNLVRALRQPAVRGRWGEVQLRRVVEMAGMVAYCDFEEQVSRGDGALRPDLVVRLPNRRWVVVDAKAPLEDYLKAAEAEDGDLRRDHLKKHAEQLKIHIRQLARKSYFEQFESTPEFVVLFLPGEAFFSAALQADPNLIEYGVENKVVPASPTTLIALLKAVAYGWQQERMAQSAEEILRLGKELYERIAKVAEHWQKMGNQLERTVEHYNEATRSLESRLLSTARKFQELRQDAAEAELTLAPIDKSVQTLRNHPIQE